MNFRTYIKNFVSDQMMYGRYWINGNDLCYKIESVRGKIDLWTYYVSYHQDKVDLRVLAECVMCRVIDEAFDNPEF